MILAQKLVPIMNLILEWPILGHNTQKWPFFIKKKFFYLMPINVLQISCWIWICMILAQTLVPFMDLILEWPILGHNTKKMAIFHNFIKKKIFYLMPKNVFQVSCWISICMILAQKLVPIMDLILDSEKWPK